MTELAQEKKTRILVLNPNSSKAMTEGIKAVIDTIGLPHSTKIHTYTGPSDAPASINDDKDLDSSTDAVSKDIQSSHPELLSYDGIVVACFSVHPLVETLRSIPELRAVTLGIFEGSILAALSLLESHEKWGIVTTGKFWEKHLTDGAIDFLGGYPSTTNSKFAGVESTGLNASDFHHGVDPAVVKQKLKEATQRLLAKPGVKCIVMGCAGMAGLEEIIRLAACEVKGKKFAYSELLVMDGILAGIMQTELAIKYQRLLRPI